MSLFIFHAAAFFIAFLFLRDSFLIIFDAFIFARPFSLFGRFQPLPALFHSRQPPTLSSVFSAPPRLAAAFSSLSFLIFLCSEGRAQETPMPRRFSSIRQIVCRSFHAAFADFLSSFDTPCRRRRRFHAARRDAERRHYFADSAEICQCRFGQPPF
jgi:hypothetical protein